MNDLGLAFELADGTLHHFMGAMFKHNTCVPVCRKEDLVSMTNVDNNFLLFGWGTSGGSKEVAQARVAAAANAATTATRGAAADVQVHERTAMATVDICDEYDNTVL